MKGDTLMDKKTLRNYALIAILAGGISEIGSTALSNLTSDSVLQVYDTSIAETSGTALKGRYNSAKSNSINITDTYDNSSGIETSSYSTDENNQISEADDVTQPISETKLVKTVSIQLETTSLDNTQEIIEQAVSASNGYIERSEASGTTDSKRMSSYCIRIPADKLDDFLSAANGSGNILYKSQNVSDITLQYTDTETHLKTLTTERDRLIELLDKADDIDAIISLENRLTNIRYELESYQSMLNHYDNQVNYATINLSISEVKLFTESENASVFSRIQTGFSKNIQTLKTTLENIIVFLCSNIPSFIIILLCISPVGIFLKLKKKKNEKKNAKNTKQDN